MLNSFIIKCVFQAEVRQGLSFTAPLEKEAKQSNFMNLCRTAHALVLSHSS